jgi:hypothetical protein
MKTLEIKKSWYVKNNTVLINWCKEEFVSIDTVNPYDISCAIFWCSDKEATEKELAFIVEYNEQDEEEYLDFSIKIENWFSKNEYRFDNNEDVEEWEFYTRKGCIFKFISCE